MTPDDFASHVRTYCSRFGGSVTSWGRTAAHNAAVGGVWNSQHLLWLAVDVVYDTIPDITIATDAARQLGLVIYREGDHDHIHAPVV
jgi:hypothetical protein